MSAGEETALSEARKKYDDHRKTRSSDTIFANYQPRRATLINSRNSKESDLLIRQSKYKDGDLGTGIEVMKAYSEEYSELTKHDLIRYEEKLKTIRDNCEIEFRESFLVKMRENIEKARTLFKELNRTLKPICYGNDSYQFSYPPDNGKRRLYEMIMSNFNLGEANLFSTQFDTEYHDEMEELFSKLMVSDEKGEDVIREYTDYRSYMDYLREKTGIHFKPFRMDIPTLKQFAAYTKPLTDNDRKRLNNLLGTEFKETVQYMLENNCKLEQESMDE